MKRTEEATILYPMTRWWLTLPPMNIWNMVCSCAIFVSLLIPPFSAFLHFWERNQNEWRRIKIPNDFNNGFSFLYAFVSLCFVYFVLQALMRMRCMAQNWIQYAAFTTRGKWPYWMLNRRHWKFCAHPNSHLMSCLLQRLHWTTLPMWVFAVAGRQAAAANQSQAQKHFSALHFTVGLQTFLPVFIFWFAAAGCRKTNKKANTIFLSRFFFCSFQCEIHSPTFICIFQTHILMPFSLTNQFFF